MNRLLDYVRLFYLSQIYENQIYFYFTATILSIQLIISSLVQKDYIYVDWNILVLVNTWKAKNIENY